MLSPPRLPALCVGFNAHAKRGSGRTSTGAAGCEKLADLHAKPCSIYMHGYFYLNYGFFRGILRGFFAVILHMKI